MQAEWDKGEKGRETGVMECITGSYKIFYDCGKLIWIAGAGSRIWEGFGAKKKPKFTAWALVTFHFDILFSIYSVHHQNQCFRLYRKVSKGVRQENHSFVGNNLLDCTCRLQSLFHFQGLAAIVFLI